MIIGLAIVFFFVISFLIYYSGYKEGHKDGFELGKKRINEYVIKVNEAQGERINELMSAKNTEI